ncbi:3-oxoacyl-[acyl-carrier-protein] reductase FabG [Mytilus coruscus]|uniref:3-oxoacyl-[acyl-carrier-protein] reductase FabG n=1 Tax=Mytilus coruscus TaxID=42192 RepID=A0A6J8C3H6_MYTCO|nr:3-oxoacyl-[acyl-carrier-protein] reductase FabG [Mytilus coruscus]
MASLGRLDGKIALITGASSGIGQGTAILFSKLGAKLAITGRNDANLKKTADECEKNGGVKVTYIYIQEGLDGGASSGIGQGTAILFSKLGAKLAITGRNDANLKKTADECEKNGGVKPLMIVADLSMEDDTKRAVEETIKCYGQLHVLVSSAGIVEVGSVETQTLEQYDKVMNINARSVFHITQLCVPYLEKTKGSIVIVSSVNGIRSFPGVIAYCMSKSAVDQFTKCAALELASKQIRVNSVNPGVIKTEIHKRGGMDEEAYQKFLERTKITHALGRPGEVQEVAGMIAFLASDDSSFITGAQVPIDGGRHCICPR